MENTYITRRIDELGRFVIPKEIRRNLKIKDNDQLEINVVNDKIVLNKYENVKKDKIVLLIVNSLRKCLNRNVLFTSRDSIIDYVLINKGTIDNKSLSEDIMNIIENRKIISNSGILNINDGITISSYMICPIIINGDIYGSIIIYGDDVINEKDKEIINYVSFFLENYLE